jgi:hypothetical protein
MAHGILFIGGAGTTGGYLMALLASSGRKISVLRRREARRLPISGGICYQRGDFGVGVAIRRGRLNSSSHA